MSVRSRNRTPVDHELLAKLCQRSYLPGGLDHAEEIGGLGPLCYVLHLPTPIVVFRGTADAAGWLADFFCAQVPSEKNLFGRLHKGFEECWQALKKRVWLAVKRKPCILTGHSLGGALATRAAIDLPVKEVVTFGAPRVGDAGFAEAYTQLAGTHTTRYVHQLDPVPMLPSWFQGFRHGSDATWHLDGRWADPSPWTLALAFCRRLVQGHEKLWADHSIDHYVRIMAAKQP